MNNFNQQQQQSNNNNNDNLAYLAPPTKHPSKINDTTFIAPYYLTPDPVREERIRKNSNNNDDTPLNNSPDASVTTASSSSSVAVGTVHSRHAHSFGLRHPGSFQDKATRLECSLFLFHGKFFFSRDRDFGQIHEFYTELYAKHMWGLTIHQLLHQHVFTAIFSRFDTADAKYTHIDSFFMDMDWFRADRHLPCFPEDVPNDGTLGDAVKSINVERPHKPSLCLVFVKQRIVQQEQEEEQEQQEEQDDPNDFILVEDEGEQSAEDHQQSNDESYGDT